MNTLSIMILVVCVAAGPGGGGDKPKPEVITASEAVNACRVLQWSTYESIMQRRHQPYHLREVRETVSSFLVGCGSDDPRLIVLGTDVMRAVVMAMWESKKRRERKKAKR